MLCAFWSPKGGSGTTTVAAACSLARARVRGARLADLAGDQAAMLGLAVRSADRSPRLARRRARRADRGARSTGGRGGPEADPAPPRVVRASPPTGRRPRSRGRRSVSRCATARSRRSSDLGTAATPGRRRGARGGRRRPDGRARLLPHAPSGGRRAGPGRDARRRPRRRAGPLARCPRGRRRVGAPGARPGAGPVGDRPGRRRRGSRVPPPGSARPARTGGPPGDRDRAPGTRRGEAAA